jgi:hypothetical protein
MKQSRFARRWKRLLKSDRGRTTVGGGIIGVRSIYREIRRVHNPSCSDRRYALLVYRGDLPQPNFDAMAKQIAPSMFTGGSAVTGAAIVVCCLLTAIAPFIYAARSGDVFTIIVSIVALVACFVLLVSSRTVIDMVLAAIIYFRSAFISVIMYSTTRIAEAIASAGGTRLAPPPNPRRPEPTFK